MDDIKFEIFKLKQRVNRIVRMKGIVEWDIAIHAVSILSSRIRILEAQLMREVKLH